MMKIFSIVCEFELKTKPDWIDNFRREFDEDHFYHITLKVHEYIPEGDTEKLKAKIGEICSKYHPMKVVFDKLFLGQTPKGHTIMIEAQVNENLMRLQLELAQELKTFGEYYSEVYKNFEENFKPHLTIGRHLNDEKLKKAVKFLKGKDLFCEAEIERITLIVANNTSVEEINNPKNRMYFRLGI